MGLAKYFEDNVEIATERMLYSRKVNPPAGYTFPRSKNPYAVHPAAAQKSTHGATKLPEVYNDLVILCKDCGRPFRYSAGWQKKIKANGWSEPKRCKSCKYVNELIHIMIK